MSLPITSLRTRILGYLALLVLTAMLLVGLVTLRIAEGEGISGILARGRLLLEVFEGGSAGGVHLETEGTQGGMAPSLQLRLQGLLRESGFSLCLVLDDRGAPLHVQGEETRLQETLLTAGRRALETEATVSGTWGTTFRLLRPFPRDVYLAAPLFQDGRRSGAVALGASLDPVVEGLLGNQRIVLLYILLNLILLVLFGYYVLSRMVVRPIKDLVRITDGFTAPERFPAGEPVRRDEIGRLTLSLRTMMERLEKNERDLKGTIASLEKANADLLSAQHELLLKEKLASVGQLAAGLAHEVGNPLGIVLGYLDLLEDNSLPESERADFLRRIQSEIVRIGRIVEQLLHVARPARGVFEPVDLKGLLAETLEMVVPRKGAGGGPEIVTRLEEGNLLVQGDRNQIKQVFLNLVLNALDAMKAKDKAEGQGEGPGRLTIEARRSPGATEIRFMDTGPGIPPEALHRVFDPFFTTKDPGKGTGLGLSVSARIMEAHRGSIAVESSPGEGSCFVLRFPVA